MVKSKFLLLSLATLFVLYTLLSWVLFFRDQRALVVISTHFYPNLAFFLANTRSFLLDWKLNTVPTALFGVFICLSFLVYFRALKEKLSARTVVVAAIVFQIIVFFSYPILSTDVLSYILSDRVAVVYHQNVWTTPPDKFPNDPFYGLADWTNQTRIYGGVNQFFYSFATQLSGKDFLANVAVHKLVVLLFVLATLAAAYWILARHFPDDLVKGLTLVFWNPLFVLETVGSGHNDILMIFFSILAIGAFLKNVPLGVGLLLGLATQIKSTPLLLAIFLAGHYFYKRNWQALVKFILSYGIVMVVIYSFMGISPISAFVRTSGSINVYWQSLPMLVNLVLPFAKPVLTGLLLLFLIWQGIKVAFRGQNAVEVYGQTLLVYLLFFLAAFWNWYPIWILTLLPFFPRSKLARPVLAYTLTAMLAYVVYWISLRLNYRFSLWPFIMYLTILSGPLAAILYERKTHKISP